MSLIAHNFDSLKLFNRVYICQDLTNILVYASILLKFEEAKKQEKQGKTKLHTFIDVLHVFLYSCISLTFALLPEPRTRRLLADFMR